MRARGCTRRSYAVGRGAGHVVERHHLRRRTCVAVRAHRACSARAMPWCQVGVSVVGCDVSCTRGVAIPLPALAARARWPGGGSDGRVGGLCRGRGPRARLTRCGAGRGEAADREEVADRGLAAGRDCGSAVLARWAVTAESAVIARSAVLDARTGATCARIVTCARGGTTCRATASPWGRRASAYGLSWGGRDNCRSVVVEGGRGLPTPSR